MHRHDEVEHILNGLEQVLLVINLNVEFILDGVVHQHAGPDVHLVIFTIPVCLECDWHAIPSVRVNVTKAVATALNDAFGHDMWLLIQVNVVLIRVVERSHSSNRRNLLNACLLGHLLEDLQHHFLQTLFN